MDQILPENWIYLHYGLILTIACAQILVVYVLSDSTHPPSGLGMYTVFFVASLLTWTAFTVQQGFATLMTVDVPAIAAIITSYILFLAVGQRTGVSRGRLMFGMVCLGSSISGFFLKPSDMFVVQSCTIALIYIGVGILSATRSYREHSVGDAIIAFAAITMFIGTALANYDLLFAKELARAHIVASGVQSFTFVLVAIGFLTSVLVEYQHHLIQLATEDPLTRLLNRRGLSEALNVSLAAAFRGRLSTSAIMVNIDHFKKVNENFGTESADHVLQHMAQILNRMARASDVIARIGGEEFLLVLPDTTLKSARIVAERIRVAIGDHPLLVDQQRIHVTVSLGVACSEGAASIDELSQAASRAMYLAKRGGRNRVASVEHKPVHITADSTTA